MQLTVEQQGLVWEGWRRGESLSLIARGIGAQLQHVRRFLVRHGGIRPPERVRHRLHLTSLEREEISRGIAAGFIGASNRSSARSGSLDGVGGDPPQRRPSGLPRRAG